MKIFVKYYYFINKKSLYFWRKKNNQTQTNFLISDVSCLARSLNYYPTAFPWAQADVLSAALANDSKAGSISTLFL